MTRYHLAHELRKTVAEIEQLTVAEYNGWIAYFDILKK